MISSFFMRYFIFSFNIDIKKLTEINFFPKTLTIFAISALDKTREAIAGVNENLVKKSAN